MMRESRVPLCYCCMRQCAACAAQCCMLSALAHLIQIIHLYEHADEDRARERERLPLKELVVAAQCQLERDAERLARTTERADQRQINT